jgi:hypothetical protein
MRGTQTVWWYLEEFRNSESVLEDVSLDALYCGQQVLRLFRFVQSRVKYALFAENARRQEFTDFGSR